MKDTGVEAGTVVCGVRRDGVGKEPERKTVVGADTLGHEDCGYEFDPAEREREAEGGNRKRKRKGGYTKRKRMEGRRKKKLFPVEGVY